MGSSAHGMWSVRSCCVWTDHRQDQAVQRGWCGSILDGFSEHHNLHKCMLHMCVSATHSDLSQTVQLANYPNLPVPIAVSLCLFGLFALPLFPVCLELGVEVTYPVAEATSSGLLWSVA